ncbi:MULTISPECIES: PilZ domain-containing protein [unclassified Sporolactobacillus]|uniref:PilZ domain-containing protein n=1 Tax=unclassified Sporolactobacillus TaxID=2628533 RepID=UPI002368C13C|nr:PilZ domain-containing protein [Sporolactobacillus sp. CQH2019]MDD9148056.1 PilZ domain-containing protein [Sporolactobacillus sp. CQH2019]
MIVYAAVAGFIAAEIIMTAIVYLIFRAHYQGVVEHERKIIVGLKRQSAAVHRYDHLRVDKGERRKHHRILLDHEGCTVRIVDFGDRSLQALNNKTIHAELIDISLGGLKFACRLNFPIVEDVLINISFQAEDKTPIYLVGTVVRKEIKHERREIFYGVQFRSLTAREETAIQNFINQKELAKKKLGLMNPR